MGAKKKTSRKAKTSGPDVDALSYEQALERLETIARQIESGEIGVEESVAMFEQGMALVARCRNVLDEAELKIRELTPDEDEEPGAD